MFTVFRVDQSVMEALWDPSGPLVKAAIGDAVATVLTFVLSFVVRVPRVRDDCGINS